MTPDEQERRDQETHDAVIQMRAVLLGVNGRGGLMQDVSDVRLDVKEMKLRSGRDEIDVATLLIKVPKIEEDVEHVKGRLDIIETGATPGKSGLIKNAASGGITGALVGGAIALIEYLEAGH